MRFQEVDETVTFYIGPLPNLLPPPTGAQWGHPGNCHEQFFSSPKIYKLHNLNVLLLDLKKMFEICMVLALGGPPPWPHGGHMYHMNNFESPASKDDSCQVG